MRDPSQHAHADLVVGIEGTFDPAAAAVLRLELARSHPTSTVVLDFSHARAVHDLGLAMVARALAAEGVATRFRGLSQHQARMLRYLGLPGVPPPAAPGEGDVHVS